MRPRIVRCGRKLVGQEAAHGVGQHRRHRDRHERQVHGYGHVQLHHGRAQQRARHGADAVAGVEPRHDRPAEPPLHHRALDVHRDVPGRAEEAEQQQTGDQQRDAQPIAETDHDQRDARCGGHPRDRAALAEPVHHPSGERPGDQRACRPGEQDRAQLAGVEAEVVPDLRNAGEPAGQEHAAAGESDVGGRGGGAHGRRPRRGRFGSGHGGASPGHAAISTIWSRLVEALSNSGRDGAAHSVRHADGFCGDQWPEVTPSVQ